MTENNYYVHYAHFVILFLIMVISAKEIDIFNL